MIDVKHRYGANLQVYHEAWWNSVTTENFFVWLDHGAGRHQDLVGCSRAKLEKERIRYLSKEERRNYLVCVDRDGLLRWAKDDELITTSIGQYQDSMHGIVPKRNAHSPTASEINDTKQSDEVTAVEELFRNTSLADSASQYGDDSSSSVSSVSFKHSPGGDVKQNSPQRKKIRRRLSVSPATVLNHLLRASVKPGTWIYVADTVGRIYVGIKSSGEFQHASFLSGARISSAGSIGIEAGKLTFLSPLSGHYRPTTRSFKAFIASLKAQQVDLSSLKISKAYAVLVGMEVYGRSKKDLHQVVHPLDEVKKHERRRRGTSRSSRASRASTDCFLVDDPVSATEYIERNWREGHEHRGMARLMGVS